MPTQTTILLALVALAALWDITQRRVPNALIAAGLLGFSFLGAAFALLLLIGPFAMRWMGGGDVKMLMMIGAFVGHIGVLYILVVGTAIHGLLGLAMLFSSRIARSKGWKPPDTQRIPHAVGFALATGMYTQGVWLQIID